MIDVVGYIVFLALQGPTPTPGPDSGGLEIVIPPNAPWWAAGFIIIVTGLFALLRQYVHHRIEKQKKESDLQIEQNKRKFEADLEFEKRKLEARIEEVQSSHKREMLQDETTKGLTEAILEQSNMMGEAVTALINNDMRASEERRVFRETFAKHGELIAEGSRTLSSHTAMVIALRDDIVALHTLSKSVESAAATVVEIIGDPDENSVDIVGMIQGLQNEFIALKKIVTNSMNHLTIVQQVVENDDGVSNSPE